ncbi:MAG: 50S ribosomal protein L9 [Candidatus Omnitrophota bacterium]
MKVILLKNLKKFGSEGDTVEVKDGYGRNYLIPQGLALGVSGENFKKFQEVKKARVKAAEKEKQSFLKLKEQIDNISLTVTVEAKEDEELYGAITEPQILKLLKAEGVDLDKGKIDIEEPVKKLGVYNFKITLYPEVQAVLRLWVMKK